MIKYLKYIIPITILSFIFYKMTIRYTPDVIYSKVKSQILTQAAISENEIRLVPFPEENHRTVVMPNPDFAYLTLFYDVEDGPLHITGNMPDSTYWSVALYEPNTTNHYVKNDMEYGTSDLNLVIGSKEHKPTAIAGAELINSLTLEGFLLIRILGTKRTEAEKAKIIDMMKSVKVEQII